jgi:hypothetical protein
MVAEKPRRSSERTRLFELPVVAQIDFLEELGFKQTQRG